MHNALKTMTIILAAGVSIAATQVYAADPATPGAQPAPREGKAYGGQRGGFGMKRMQRMDTDKSGSVSKTEYLAERTSKFQDIDANRDGFADATEITAQFNEPAEFRMKRLMKRVDANRDGKITKDEFEQVPRAAFQKRDLNNDGKLDANDRPPQGAFGWFGGGKDRKMGLSRGRQEQTLDAVVQRADAEFAKADLNSDGALDQSEVTRQVTDRIDFAKKRLMHRSDENNDGKLSQDEFMSAPLKRFSNLDLNDDGQLDAKDFPAQQGGWFSR